MEQKKVNNYLYLIIAAVVLGVSRFSYNLGIFGFISFIPMFRFFEAKKHNGFDLVKGGMLFSLINTLVAYHWIAEVTLPGLIGMIVLFGLYYWAVFSAINYVWHKADSLKWIAFTSIWLSFEFFLFHTELRFPWLNIGYTMVDFNYLAQIADIGGVHILSLVVLLVNIFLYLLMNGNKQYLYALIVLFTIWFGYGYIRFQSIDLTKEDLKVKMMQPSVGTEKFDMPLQQLFDKYDKQAYYASLEDTDLHIWPEAAIPDMILMPRNENMRNQLRKIAKRYKLSIFFGTTDALPAPKDYYYPNYYYNAAALLNYPSLEYSEPYYKRILVPVGERMPYLNAFPFLWKLQFGQANWEFGKEAKYYTIKNRAGKEFTFSPQICYEIIFPSISNEIARKDVDFIVNITNDVWFGESIGTVQHAMMTRIRAIESRKAIIRCANNGHSMVVSPNGKIETYSRLNDIANFDAPIYTTESSSLYVRYLYMMPYMFLLSALTVFFTCQV